MPLEMATREQSRLRMLIAGATGSGKTCTAIQLATAIARRYKGRIGLIDTQHKQSRDYAGTKWAPLGFFPYDLNTGDPLAYVNALGIFAKENTTEKDKPPYVVVIIDGLADAWQGEGGTLEKAGDNPQFTEWRNAKNPNFRLMTAIQKAPFHVIATCLSDTQYVIKTNTEGKIEKGGISVVGTKPIQDKKAIPRFNVQAAMDESHRMTVIRTSFSPYDRAMVDTPGEDWMGPLLDWFETGVEPADFRVETKAASLEQIREYYELQLALGNNKESVDPAFFKRYGSLPKDCTEEFLEERLVELRERRVVGRPTAGASGGMTNNPSPRFSKSPEPGQPSTKLEKDFDTVINEKGK